MNTRQATKEQIAEEEITKSTEIEKANEVEPSWNHSKEENLYASNVLFFKLEIENCEENKCKYRATIRKEAQIIPVLGILCNSDSTKEFSVEIDIELAEDSLPQKMKKICAMCEDSERIYSLSLHFQGEKEFDFDAEQQLPCIINNVNTFNISGKGVRSIKISPKNKLRRVLLNKTSLERINEENFKIWGDSGQCYLKELQVLGLEFVPIDMNPLKKHNCKMTKLEMHVVE